MHCAEMITPPLKPAVLRFLLTHLSACLCQTFSATSRRDGQVGTALHYIAEREIPTVNAASQQRGKMRSPRVHSKTERTLSTGATSRVYASSSMT
ncbi:hypothetical protein FN846DRAFT_977965 [Sphaerosporella brunnea]|uniref:Secreted protein n=1 Tax=Sphaerosporella brunnea TaxID=1250544 RepID=A0A5J5EFX5_9PEZI|nr:hypothetical protein FN846DRAFT_977965 [Sphaerosporella brunnea]